MPLLSGRSRARELDQLHSQPEISIGPGCKSSQPIEWRNPNASWKGGASPIKPSQAQRHLPSQRASQLWLTFEIVLLVTASLPPSHQEKVSLIVVGDLDSHFFSSSSSAPRIDRTGKVRIQNPPSIATTIISSSHGLTHCTLVEHGENTQENAHIGAHPDVITAATVAQSGSSHYCRICWRNIGIQA